MNVFGITVQRRKTLDAAMAALTAPAAVDDDPNVLESVKFGRVYTKGTSREMLTTLTANSNVAERYSRVALYVSIPHQALYLLSQVQLRHSTPLEWAETCIAFAMALVIPFLVDQAILMNIRTLAARAASAGSKWRAGAMLAITIPTSMYVNFAAPGAQVLRYGAAGLVLLVGIYQISRLVRPDFKKVGQTERAMTAQVEDLQAAVVAAAPTRLGGGQAVRRSKKELDRCKAQALAFARLNPNVLQGQLARTFNISPDAAKKILASLGQAPVDAPVSPGVGPVLEYTGRKA